MRLDEKEFLWADCEFRSRIFRGRLRGVAQIDSFTPSFWIWITYLGAAVQKNGVLGRRWRGEGQKHANSYTFLSFSFPSFRKRSFLTGISFFSGFGFAQIRSLNVVIQFKRETAS